ncbi:Solute carrier 26, partial [Nowakowskiella sp. JEL0078]
MPQPDKPAEAASPKPALPPADALRSSLLSNGSAQPRSKRAQSPDHDPQKPKVRFFVKQEALPRDPSSSSSRIRTDAPPKRTLTPTALLRDMRGIGWPEWDWGLLSPPKHQKQFRSSEEVATESTPLLDSDRSTTPVIGFSSDEDSSLVSSNGNQKRSFWYVFYTRLRYYVPVIGWFPNYEFGNLSADIIAGITVAFLLIPQALSYAQVLVKIPPVYGLYTCMLPLLTYSLLGTSKQLAVGPEALVSILVGSTIQSYHGNLPVDGSITAAEFLAEKIATANLLALLVGVFTCSLGMLRLGFLDSVLSRALLRGFVTAVAVVVAIDMLPQLFGILSVKALLEDMEPEKSPIEKFLAVIEHLSELHTLTTIISLVSISFLIIVRILKEKYSKFRALQLFPEILILVLGSTILSAEMRWDLQGVEVLKDVQGGFIMPRFPKIDILKIRSILLSAILIAIIGFVESIAVAKTYASKNGYSISPNRELVALGTGNILSSIGGGWPAFGSLGRSAVNSAAGSKTQLSGFVTFFVIVFTTIYFLKYFYYLPKAVCSAIIAIATLKLVEFEEINFILKLRAWGDVFLMSLTFLTTIFVSIEAGTLISVGVSLLLVIKHTTTTRIAILGQSLIVDPRTNQVKVKFRSLDDSGPVERIDGSLIIRIEDGLYFGNTGQLKDRLKRVEIYGELGVHPGEAPRLRKHTTRPDSPGTDSPVPEPEGISEIHSVIFDFEGVTEIDASATLTLLEIVEEYHHRNILVCFVKVRENCRTQFDRSGLFELVGEQNFFSKINTAVDFARSTESSKNGSASHSTLNIGDTEPVQTKKVNNGTSKSAKNEIVSPNPVRTKADGRKLVAREFNDAEILEILSDNE